MEPFIGFVIAGILGIGIPIYRRYFASEGARNPQFEKWCRTAPVVAAFRCESEDTVDVYNLVRHEIEPKGEFINSSGRFPWQHYVVDIDCRRLTDEIIVFHVTGCRPAKIHHSRPDLAKSIEAIGQVAGARIEDVWLHGQLHAVRHILGVDKEQAAWVGKFDGEGRLDVLGMIGQPPWLTSASANP